MSLVDTAAARPNGSAGPPAMAPLDAPAGAPPAADRPTRRSPILAHPLELREQVKAQYEGTTKSIKAIGEEFGVGRTTIIGWARQDEWVRAAGAPAPRAGASGAVTRERLMGRLFRVYGRQLATLEKRAVKGTDEKDARTLSVLAKTLETLIALDRDDGGKATKPESVNRGDYRAVLARTLSRWAEEGEKPEEAS